MLKREYCYDQHLPDATWARAKGNNDMIGYAEIVSVSTSYSRCSTLAWSSLSTILLPHVLQTISSYATIIYSIDTLLYPYDLPLL